jgi:hypothetical protein
MGRKIDKYEEGPDKPEHSNTYLQDLFATIEAACDSEARLGNDVKSDKRWNANQAHASENKTQQTPKKDCFYGDKCHRTHCTFRHPKESGGPMRTPKGRHDRQPTKTRDGRQQRSKHICKAKGCSQRAPDANKLCDTCYKSIRVDGGTIECKDGSMFTLQPRPAEHNADKKKMFGFTAQQLEGIKLMKRALTAGSIEQEEADRPAPASVKRKRIHDRLGWGNAAVAISKANGDNEEQQRLEFLKAIDASLPPFLN